MKSYRAYNDYTGEVVECTAISKNRAKKRCERTMKWSMQFDDVPQQRYKRSYRGGELRFYCPSGERLIWSGGVVSE